MSQIGQAAGFATRLYTERARTGWAAYVQRDPMARLRLRPGRDDPYVIYDRIRAEHGTLMPTRLGQLGHAQPPGVQPGAAGPPLRGPADRGGAQPGYRRLGPVVPGAESAGPHPAAAAGDARVQPKGGGNTYRDRIEQTVGDLLDQAAAAGEFDLVSAVRRAAADRGHHRPARRPGRERRGVRGYGASIGSALDGIKVAAPRGGTARPARRPWTSSSPSLFELRRREPADDIISTLVAAEGDQIRPGEMLPMCVLLLVAGFETTVNLIGNAVLALLDHPDQWAALCADPEGLALAAVEETLRWDPPVQRTARVALETGGTRGPHSHKGPDRDHSARGGQPRPRGLRRSPACSTSAATGGPDHLAFSSGIHYCIGQPLARLEATDRPPDARRSACPGCSGPARWSAATRR